MKKSIEKIILWYIDKILGNVMKRSKVSPDRIIQTTQEYFYDVLTKPDLKNLGLTSYSECKENNYQRDSKVFAY